MTRAYCCQECDSAFPRWVITRRGDAVITWSCDADLADVCADLQRANESTELLVTERR